MKRLLVIVAGLGVLVAGGCVKIDSGSGPALVDGKLIIADFDSGTRPNNLGGDFGAWNKDPNDKTQFCEASFSNDVRVGEEGYSIKLKYDVDSPEAAYNGFWMKLVETDFSNFTDLVFSVKGDPEAGYTDKFKIELKNARGEKGEVMIMGITDMWNEKVVPLSSFKGMMNFEKMEEMIIVFDDQNSSPKTGEIYIDNIYAE